MSLGQTMLSIATLVALTVMVVTSQRYLIEGQKESLSAESIDLASGAAESLLWEITKKDFDASMDYSKLQPTNEFTAPGSLGPRSIERSQLPPYPLPDTSNFRSFSAYNDIDDYDGYYRKVDTELLKGIELRVRVFYVANPSTTSLSSVTTYYKRVEVTVQEMTPYLPEMKFTIVISY